ncbi:MAG: hypothetical protein AABZ05_06355 [Nitrospirota bacterium]
MMSNYFFPGPSYPGAIEWDGSPIGRSNVITRTRSRTTRANKVVDETPGLLDRLLSSAKRLVNQNRTKIYQSDVIIHGIRVRATTNSPHLIKFWRMNWFSPDEWKGLTSMPPEEVPRVIVYALTGVADEEEAAYYSRSTDTIIFFNTSYYGQLKSWVLGAVGRILARDFGIHSIHGACVTKDDLGVLYIAPTGTGKSTSSYGLMQFDGTRFHSDDWVYVRYAYSTKEGKKVSPLSIEDGNGSIIRGYEVYRRLEREGINEDLKVTARTLDDNIIILKAKDLDIKRGTEAYAYISEKLFYLRSSLVESFPESIPAILESDIENAPDIKDEFIKENEEVINSSITTLDKLDYKWPRGADFDEKARTIGRMFAFDNSRGMLDIASMFGREPIFTNPLEPARLTSVVLLRRDMNDPRVAEYLPLNRFMSRLLIGETPMKTREIAYNAYRAVDDKKEKDWINFLERETKAKGPEDIYDLYTEKKDIPETLREEFELFRVMNRSALCFDINTVLQNDPMIKSKREAVQNSLKVILKTIINQPRDLRLDIANYREFIRDP